MPRPAYNPYSKEAGGPWDDPDLTAAMIQNMPGRRRLITALATTAALGDSRVEAAPPAAHVQPSWHASDTWLATRAAKHRVILDVATAAGVVGVTHAQEYGYRLLFVG